MKLSAVYCLTIDHCSIEQEFALYEVNMERRSGNPINWITPPARRGIWERRRGLLHPLCPLPRLHIHTLPQVGGFHSTFTNSQVAAYHKTRKSRCSWCNFRRSRMRSCREKFVDHLQNAAFRCHTCFILRSTAVHHSSSSYLHEIIQHFSVCCFNDAQFYRVSFLTI